MKVKYELEKNGYNEKILNLYREHYPERYAFVVDSKPYFYAVAKVKKEIVGAMAVHKKGEEYTFLHVVVHPDYRKQRIANNLLHMVVRYCIEDGAEVIVNRKRAESLFSIERFYFMGFQKINQYKDHEGQQRILLVMNVQKDADMKYLRSQWKAIQGRKFGFP